MHMATAAAAYAGIAMVVLSTSIAHAQDDGTSAALPDYMHERGATTTTIREAQLENARHIVALADQIAALEGQIAALTSAGDAIEGNTTANEAVKVQIEILNARLAELKDELAARRELDAELVVGTWSVGAYGSYSIPTLTETSDHPDFFDVGGHLRYLTRRHIGGEVSGGVGVVNIGESQPFGVHGSIAGVAAWKNFGVTLGLRTRAFQHAFEGEPGYTLVDVPLGFEWYLPWEWARFTMNNRPGVVVAKAAAAIPVDSPLARLSGCPTLTFGVGVDWEGPQELGR